MTNEFLRLPKRIEHPGARDYLKAEFRRLMAVMCAAMAKELEDVDLIQSLAMYNKSRERLRAAYRMHRIRPDIWTAMRVQTLMASAFRVPREEHLSWMEGLPWEQEPFTENDSQRMPIYVRGKVWDPPEILQVLDEVGFSVADDEMVTGHRAIAQDAPMDGDPFDGLVERHMKTIPYPGYHVNPSAVVDGFVKRVRDSGAKGVLFLNPKFCEEAGFETPDLQAALRREDIPDLHLETSVRGVSLGQIRVRLEAFGEILRGDLS
jgi:benzoyl-CoA reductase/2-hydroxyglutaryl-CoA dehydratase subunit BcrC/BadD/HgdB